MKLSGRLNRLPISPARDYLKYHPDTMNKINDVNQSLLQYDHDIQQQKKEERKRKKEEASQELVDNRNDANNSNAEHNNRVGDDEDKPDDASFGGTDSGNICDNVEHDTTGSIYKWRGTSLRRTRFYSCRRQ